MASVPLIIVCQHLQGPVTKNINEMVNESFDSCDVNAQSKVCCITTHKYELCRCGGMGGSWERLPASTPQNLFVHVSKTDAGLVL